MLKRLTKHSTFICLFILFLLSSLHLVFALRTSLFFAEDDFALLSYVKNASLFSLFQQFFLNGDIFGFRKVLGHFNFKLLFDLFGVNPVPYILNNHILHLANLFLLFFIVKKLTKRSFVALFVGVLYNKFYLYSFMNIHDYLVTFFSLCSIYLFVRSEKFSVWSLFFFVLALLTREVAFGLPFFFLTLSLINKTGFRKILPYFLFLALYGVYQLSFLLTGRFTPGNESYAISFDFSTLKNNLLFYFKPLLIIFLLLIPLVSKKFKPYLILLVVLITLFPTLTLINRHLLYYLYFPMSYLMIYLGLTLPNISIKTIILYVICFLVFGGRSVFPLIARQDYPNWQKVSLENVTRTVEATIKKNPDTKQIDISSINIERDAYEMLRNNVLDLFIGEALSGQYMFESDLIKKLIYVRKKI